jgi:ABC-type nickel/cobalt efflux system permease component RcnA
MFLSQYIMPDKITKWLGILSGLTIVWIGGLLFYRRLKSLLHKAESHGHHHNHDHGHSHGHSHEHAHHSHSHAEEEHAHAHSHGIPHTHEHVQAVAHTHEPHTHATDTHEHGTQDHSHSHSHDEKHEHSHAHHHDHSHSHGLTHTHDGHTHSHVPEGEISMKSLIALGASGGLVPCPGALILLLSAISLGRPGLGLLLLLSFSLGLALVLMATGLLVLYAKNLFPERKRDGDGLVFRLLPVISAAVILVVGVVLTGNALGVIPVVRFFG